MNRTILDHSLWGTSPDSAHLYLRTQQDAVWLKIANAGHFAFSDCAWAVETPPKCRPGAVATNACVVWCFNPCLKGESPSFPTHPELINVQSKRSRATIQVPFIGAVESAYGPDSFPGVCRWPLSPSRGHPQFLNRKSDTMQAKPS